MQESQDSRCVCRTLAVKELIKTNTMHPQAFYAIRKFLETYLSNQRSSGFKNSAHDQDKSNGLTQSRSNLIVDIGSYDPTYSIRRLVNQTMPKTDYIGLDQEKGPNVDLVLSDPYKFPLPDRTANVVISTSVFEHVEFFWVLYLEILRILAEDGLFLMIAPSRGPYHKHPVDCWRFYPDSSRALVNWAKQNHYSPKVLESFTSTLSVDQSGKVHHHDLWADHIAVHVKEGANALQYPNRLISAFGPNVANATVNGRSAEPKYFSHHDQILMNSPNYKQI